MLCRRIFFFSLLFVISPLFFSCDSSDGEGSDGGSVDLSSCTLNGPNLSISDISGNWAATQSTFSIPDTSEQLDVVAEGGLVTLNVETNGRFTLTITPEGFASEITTGNLTFCDGLFTVRYDDARNQTETLTITLNNDVLSITGPILFDVDDNGSDDDAFVIFRFERG